MSYVIHCTSQLKTFSYQWKKCNVPWSTLIESSDASDKFLYISVHFFSYKHFKHFKPYKLQSSTSIFYLTLRELHKSPPKYLIFSKKKKNKT